jgi:hypothetical protein
MSRKRPSSTSARRRCTWLSSTCSRQQNIVPNESQFN